MLLLWLFRRRHLVALERSALPLVPPGVMVGRAFLLRSCGGLVLHDNSSHSLFARGLVSRNVQELVSGSRILAPLLVDQCFAACAGEESIDHVSVDDVREGVAILGEATDVISEGLAALLLAAFKIPGIAWADVHALEVSDKHLPQVRPAADRIGRHELEPGTNVVS